MSQTVTHSAASETNNGEDQQWWRSAVIYQIYPRSFADANGDGIGDLPGITSKLDSLSELGIDAIWLSPFMSSPQKDAGYDVSNYRDVDPIFGTLNDFDELLKQAHQRGIKLLVDLVPNHSSDQHEWFQQALAAPAGSPERAMYIFRDGKGENGDEAPNNWQSVFGGPAWTRTTNPDGTPGQWYLHLFDSSQPDFDWENPRVHQEFQDILRFWLDRGVDGFRVDVAHGLVKAPGLPDFQSDPDFDSMGGNDDAAPFWGQEGVHKIHEEWHQLLAEYDGDRALCAEAWMPTVAKTARFVAPGRMHQTFNFGFLLSPWNADSLRQVITESLYEYQAVGAPSTWVLSNHDVIRHASRLALTERSPQGSGIGPRSSAQPIPELGLKRARAASALMLALPGSAYIYQGEELGLPEVVELPDDSRQDPTWFRTDGEQYGRDGCRVPLPWEAEAPASGFNTTGKSWLPQPEDWADYARGKQRNQEGSTLELYKELIKLREEHQLGTGELIWRSIEGDNVLRFENNGVLVVSNISDSEVPLPEGEVLARSGQSLPSVTLEPDETAWIRL